MDNLAHSLLGLVAAKAGLEKVSPGATSVCILAANAPDLDFIYALSGDRWTILHHHRGVSHSIVGTLLLGIAIPALFCLIESIFARSRNRPRRYRFRGLLLVSLIACATHPLLDWTNNYGVRPLLPWSGQWFYGDLVFVVDPVLWLVLGGAAYLLTAKSKVQTSLWGLIAALLTALVLFVAIVGRGLEHPVIVILSWVAALVAIVVFRRFGADRRFGHRIALAALCTLLVYWGTLGVLHSKALRMGAMQASALVAGKQERILRLAAMPTLANPEHWRCVFETDKAVYRFEMYLTAPWGTPPELVRYAKAEQAQAGVLAEAMEDRRTQAFLEFARFPVEKLAGDCASQLLVQFADLRYTEPGKTRGNFSLEVPVDCDGVDVAADGRE